MTPKKVKNDKFTAEADDFDVVLDGTQDVEEDDLPVVEEEE